MNQGEFSFTAHAPQTDVSKSVNQYLDGFSRPWGDTPRPQVSDPWNWVAYTDVEGNRRYQRVRD